MSWLRFPRAAGLVVCLYLLAVGLLFAGFSARNDAFVRDAATTTGTVVALVPRAAAGSSREPGPSVRTMPLAPTVSYTVAGRTYRYTAAHGRYRQRLRVGDSVSIRYLPSDPGQARVQGEDRVLIPALAVGFGLAALGVVVLLVATRGVGRPGTGPGRRRRPAGPGGLPEEVEPDAGPRPPRSPRRPVPPPPDRAVPGPPDASPAEQRPARAVAD